MMDYILEWVNGDSNEIMCKQVYEDVDNVVNKIKQFYEIERKRDKSSIVVLVDSSGAIWNAEFLNYSIHKYNLEESIVLRVFFKIEKRAKKSNRL